MCYKEPKRTKLWSLEGKENTVLRSGKNLDEKKEINVIIDAMMKRYEMYGGENYDSVINAR
ncbi:hypothetical protein [Abyssisolibacter fermentans]|uniref:hypothetical protein n=1 Tax=Abyssisolibacter fermentans TaxID=1766203 RepID=UPI0012E3D5B0|nr:hypothetical protein [Abyssisolibacter fermentans]